MTKQQEEKRAELKQKLLAKAKNMSEEEKEGTKKEVEVFKKRFPLKSLDSLTLEKFCAGEGKEKSFCSFVNSRRVASVNIALTYYGIYWKGDEKKYWVNEELEKYQSTHQQLDLETIASELIFKPLAEFIRMDQPDSHVLKNLRKYIRIDALLKMLILYHYDKYFPIVTKTWLKKVCDEFGLQSDGSHVGMNLAIKKFSDELLKEIGDLNLNSSAVYSVFKEMGLVEKKDPKERKDGQTDTNQSNDPEDDEVIDWLEPCFWKISMAGLTEKQRKLCEERCVIAIRRSKDKNWKQRLNEAKYFQGRMFEYSLRKGDFVYICCDGKVCKLVQIDDEPVEAMQGLILRHYHEIEGLKKQNSIYSDEYRKVWTPNEDTIFVRVASGDHPDFDEKILRPFFGTSVADLKTKYGRCVEAKYWCVVAKRKVWGGKGLPGMVDGDIQTYSIGKVYEAFMGCREWDKVIGFACGDGSRRACALLSFYKILCFDKAEWAKDDKWEFKKKKNLNSSIEFEQLQNLGIFKKNYQGIYLVPVTRRQYKECMRLAGEELTEKGEKSSDAPDVKNNCEGDQYRIDEALKDDTLKEYVELLRDKKQIVLTGAPGTGKTYLARMIAERITGDKLDGGQFDAEHIAMCQFHPTFDYSDFVEGLRPCEKNGTLGFKRKNGMFMDFCCKALEQGTRNFVFIIDEINRGDLSKIFGELFFAIEKSYRGTSGLKTRYNNLMAADHPFREGFYVPNNVYIIGTMNDIDRGVESIDFAIRRRFGWIEVTPAKRFKEIMEGAGIKDDEAKRIEKVMRDLNDEIEDKDSKYGLGPAYCIGPSYFAYLKENDFSWDDLWNRALEPLLREYLRGISGVADKIKKLSTTYFDAIKEKPSNDEDESVTTGNTGKAVGADLTQQ